MPYEVHMPRLGWNMEKGTLVEWRKKDGEHVEAGEILFVVGGDKADQEVEALESGILRIPPDSPPPGTEAEVGTLLGYILQPGEPLPFAAPTAATPTATTPVAGATPVEAPRSVAPGAGPAPRPTARRPAISPRALRVARELGVEWASLRGSGRSGRIVERDVRQAAAAPPSPPVRISPLARRAAAELGVDVAHLAAQVPGGRIARADVEAAAKAAEAAPAPALPEAAVTAAPMSPTRKIIAERMAASAHTTAAVTLTTEADATELVRLRRQLKADAEMTGQPVPGYNDLLAKIVAQALMEHPALNARLEGDRIIVSHAVHIGLAVDTERGLLVPVLRDVQAKTVRQIARESAPLVERVRAGQASADDLRGSTFTITNLGMYEIDAFTPIVNPPECAILGVGRIVPKQVVMDAEAEKVAVRQMVCLSLTFDHRLVDGAPAARFLQRVKQYVERPYLWLVG
jgi:pyruvate dehydrogenase E2 component (dihydrolipoamide acetyltransferase)